MSDHHTTGELRVIDGGKTDARSKLDNAKVRHERWRMKYADRLAELHPDVAAEVSSLAWERIRSGEERAMAADDMHQCRMRVASRMRIQRYGRCTEDEEAGRQLRECLAEIGGAP